MSKIDDREILRQLQQLSQIEPTPQATNRAIARVRDALTVEAHSQRSRLLRRIAMPAGIAASVLISITALFIALPPSACSA